MTANPRSGRFWLAGAFALATACSGIAGAARAEGTGRLLLANPLTGAYITAGVDQYGDYNFRESGSYSYLIGAYRLIATPSAIIAYRPAIGGAAAYLLDGRGSLPLPRLLRRSPRTGAS